MDHPLYPPSRLDSDGEPELHVSRRDLRAVHRPQKAWVRRAIAAGAGVALIAATFGAASLNTSPETQVASLHAAGDSSISPRGAGASRSVDRLPLERGEFTTIAVTVDGEVTEVSTNARTLAEALAEADIEVGYNDIVNAPMNGEPVDVTILRVVESIETVEEKVPFSTTRTESASLPKGQERVQTKGRDGMRTATKRILRQGEEIVHEEMLASAVGAEPVAEVILVGTATGASSAGASTPVPSGPAPSAGSNRGVAKAMLASYGWGDDQWGCLDRLWQRESGWRHTARNSSSGAYGIPQSLPASKMASAGGDYLTNPATQIRWGLSYIKGRYSSPCGAWSHSQRTGWY